MGKLSFRRKQFWDDHLSVNVQHMDESCTLIIIFPLFIITHCALTFTSIQKQYHLWGKYVHFFAILEMVANKKCKHELLMEWNKFIFLKSCLQGNLRKEKKLERLKKLQITCQYFFADRKKTSDSYCKFLWCSICSKIFVFVWRSISFDISHFIPST